MIQIDLHSDAIGLWIQVMIHRFLLNGRMILFLVCRLLDPSTADFFMMTFLPVPTVND